MLVTLHNFYLGGNAPPPENYIPLRFRGDYTYHEKIPHLALRGGGDKFVLIRFMWASLKNAQFEAE